MFEDPQEVQLLTTNIETQKALFKIVKEKSVLINEPVSLPYCFTG